MSIKKQSSVMAEVKGVLIRNADEIQSLATNQHKKFLGKRKSRSKYLEKYQKNHVFALKYIAQNLNKKNFVTGIKRFQKMGEDIGNDAIKEGLTIE
ncbi:MAG: hypothetical protein KGL95_16095, partial [Patescibacteria group bacterium]|nr:hypothetical protein [Patescibacteria group bacterium]